MGNFFVTSDTHFSHANILTFKATPTTMLRPGFRDVLDMNEQMVENWNKVVRPQDHIWHLGDVAMKRDHLQIVKRLNGHKRLVMGNHDIFAVEEYLEAGFEKVMGMRVMDGLIMTHVPIHPDSLKRFKANIHGHTHSNHMMLHPNVRDPRYINLCVENWNYTPVALEEIKRLIK